LFGEVQLSGLPSVLEIGFAIKAEDICDAHSSCGNLRGFGKE
jgi:hypothetical protein